MTSFRHQASVLALVAAGLFPSVTIASPDSGTVGRQGQTGSRQMALERGAHMAQQNKYRPHTLDWINRYAPNADKSNAPLAMNGEIARTLETNSERTYRFGAPNAGFEIAVNNVATWGGGSQQTFLLRQDIKSEADFQKLQGTIDPKTNKPFISPNASWQREGKYPVGAFTVRQNARGADEGPFLVNPYDYVDNPGAFEKQLAVVQLFGLPKDQEGVAHGEIRAGVNKDFPDVQGRSGLSNVFSGLFGGGQQQQRPQQQQQQQQHPGQQQRPTNCDGPGALDGAIGGNGRGGVQINLGKLISNVAKPKPPGCE